MFDGKFRAPVDKAVKPLGNGLRRTGLTPDHLTVIGLLVAVGAAVAVGFGQLRLGLALVILAALPDLLDGALAKASNSSSLANTPASAARMFFSMSPAGVAASRDDMRADISSSNLGFSMMLGFFAEVKKV